MCSVLLPPPWSVAYKHLVDTVPAVIENEAIRGLEWNLEQTPMLYGEGKKAFHRLQLEIIRTSNDQSIFAWDCNARTGSILADDPSEFHGCGEMEVMGHNEFIQYIKADVPEEELDSIEDRLEISAQGSRSPFLVPEQLARRVTLFTEHVCTNSNLVSVPCRSFRHLA